MMTVLKRFLMEEEGLETVEYAVMTALIVGAVIVAVGALAVTIGNRFDEVRTTIGGGA